MKRMRFSSLLLLLLLCASSQVFAQRDSLRSLFLDAESWFLFEEYAEALPLYQEIYKSDPGNHNLQYKIGICLLNDPYQKDQSIQYLKEASQHLNPGYKENHFREKDAPVDALFYLGNAYLVNELFDRAIESYKTFLKVMDPEIYDKDLVTQQMKSCKNAISLKRTPLDLELMLVDSQVNTKYSEVRPVISGDGSTMAYISELPFYDGAFVSKKTESGWSYPRLITQDLGFDSDVYPVCLNYDGSEMIIYSDDNYIGNLYHSQFVDGAWQEAIKLGENINTKYWESHAAFDREGQTLYFTSNRKGGFGGLDIYVSEKQSDGKWGPAVNLGARVNTRYNEESPAISEDGKTLYFSSYGHYNMGGYDIFFSRKDPSGKWLKPENIGYPINTTDDDLFYSPVKQGENAYYSLYSPHGSGRHDIYYLTIYSKDHPRYYDLSGYISLEDGSTDSTELSIFVIDVSTGDTVFTTSAKEDGSFVISLPEGAYDLHVMGEQYNELITSISIDPDSNKKGIVLPSALLLTRVEDTQVIPEEEASLASLSDTLLPGTPAESHPIQTAPVPGDPGDPGDPAYPGDPDDETELLQPPVVLTDSTVEPTSEPDSTGEVERSHEESVDSRDDKKQDDRNIPLYLWIFVIGAVVFIIILVRRRKKKE